MASTDQGNTHSKPSPGNQMAFLMEEAAAKLVAIRCEMSIRNFKSAQQYIYEHSQLVYQIKQLKIKQLKEEFIFSI